MEPAPEIEVSRVSFASYARLLGGNRNFRRLWSAQVVSEIGDWFYTLAIYNLLLQLTGRAGSVALALVLLDYSLAPAGKTLLDSPQIVQALEQGMLVGTADSPAFRDAPIFLKDELTSAY